MAIALEADFTSPKASRSEPADKQAGKTGLGEGFANTLTQARASDDISETSAPSPEAALLAAPLPYVAVPAVTGAELPADMDTPPVADEAAIEALGLDPKSEILVDRALVRSDIEARVNDQTPDALVEAPDSPAEITPVEGQGVVADAPAEKTDATKPDVSAEPVPAAAQTALVAPATTTDTAQPSDIAVRTTAALATTVPPANVRTAAPQQAGTKLAATEAGAFELPPQEDDAARLDTVVSDGRITPATDTFGKVPAFDSSADGNPTPASPSVLSAAPAAPQPVAATPALTPATPAHAILTASPAQIVDIVSEAADDRQSDRVVVQLDPPELGRVSIDFKFDMNGLQHITITSETPEAMRQLRQMHFELVQSLERHGIGSENMSFQHQQQGTPQSQAPNPFARNSTLSETGAAMLTAAEQIPGARTLPGGRLDIRL